MKITKSKIRQIIKEEINKLSETPDLEHAVAMAERGLSIVTRDNGKRKHVADMLVGVLGELAGRAVADEFKQQLLATGMLEPKRY